MMMLRSFSICVMMVESLGLALLAQLLLSQGIWQSVSALGSMSSIAISSGEKGPVFCGLKPDGSQLVSCYGSNPAIISAVPARVGFAGLTAGDGFICGLLMDSSQPYCWGSSDYVQMGVPQPMVADAEYQEISAGDYHLCGLRKFLTGRRRNISFIDCWGYNLTRNYVFEGRIQAISAGSVFNCGLFSENGTAFCWGDESSSRVISLVPPRTEFLKIAAGGFHVCGIINGGISRTFCWGRSLDLEEAISAAYSLYSNRGNVDLPPRDSMLSIVGGKFHACGIKASDNTAICWGFMAEPSTPVPADVKFLEIAAGDYFTCGLSAGKSVVPHCWGLGFPTSLPLPVPTPDICSSAPCPPGTYKSGLDNSSASCNSSVSPVCLPCSGGCPAEMYQIAECTIKSDRQCGYNCSSCFTAQCFSNCSIGPSRRTNERFWSLQLPVIIAEISFAMFLVIVVAMTAVLYVRYRLRYCRCLEKDFPAKPTKGSGVTSPFNKMNNVVPHSTVDNLKIKRARKFTYLELETATDGFKEESQVGKGSFSCVFRGVLKDGTVVAVKRALKSSSDKQKNTKEFQTELDLLSRLNHAHLLNLLGYCEEDGEILLVYEFMAHGSLHQHLHGKNKSLKEQLNWVRRVTIAVQAARGIEYLHGYACPPVIHRDIKSSNILIDEEHNARVADFGLSLLGPVDSSLPLSEQPAGTLGYLDPEYYRLHYLTTKSDVYSFGVLLLEILSGRKAIDMQYEEGNIVEWAVPLIKAGDIAAILDPDLKTPPDAEALRRIANVACKCVRMRGKDRPSMDQVTTALERALAQLMGSPCIEQPILPTEVVLGSSRMHKKSSQRSSNRSAYETDAEDQRIEFRAPSWITFPSVTSSQRRKSSVSDAEIEGKNFDGTKGPGANATGGHHGGDGLRSLDEEIGPASPQEKLFLQHNF
ncbi:hypothetical protein MLD38_023854 [Melastoma candidum]|uniref:Uncharacterized protein n=1 Tax=Melastoma candidum TaxID=119954 RepID=A0ACB9NS80_9MYRT|nr:hypothetical protein MLD38_023854 [Melastoma candidum]